MLTPCCAKIATHAALRWYMQTINGVCHQLLRRCSYQKEATRRVDFATRFHVELAVEILSYLPAAELARAKQVCRGWRVFVETHQDRLSHLSLRRSRLRLAAHLDYMDFKGIEILEAIRRWFSHYGVRSIHRHDTFHYLVASFAQHYSDCNPDPLWTPLSLRRFTTGVLLMEMVVTSFFYRGFLSVCHFKTPREAFICRYRWAFSTLSETELESIFDRVFAGFRAIRRQPYRADVEWRVEDRPPAVPSLLLTTKPRVGGLRTMWKGHETVETLRAVVQQQLALSDLELPPLPPGSVLAYCMRTPYLWMCVEEPGYFCNFRAHPLLKAAILEDIFIW